MSCIASIQYFFWNRMLKLMLHYIILLDFQSVFALQIKKAFYFSLFRKTFWKTFQIFWSVELGSLSLLGVQIYISAYVATKLRSWKSSE